jgi:YidC/Oxa1 family membrane protein insertase
MEKRVLLAVVLSFVVLYGYQVLFPPAKPAPKGSQTSGSTPAAQTQASSASSTATPAVAEAPEPPAPSPDEGLLVGERAERDIVVENSSVHAVFSNRGGVLKSWTLKRYPDEHGRPLELVPQIVNGAPRPFTVVVDDAKVSAKLKSGLYKPSADAVTVAASPETLTFEYRDSAGVSARKEFRFDPAQPYVIGFTASVTQDGNSLTPTIDWGPALGTGMVERAGSYSPPPRPLFYRDGSVTRIKPANIQKTPHEQGTFGFVGVDDHYFLSVALPAQPVGVEYQPVSVPVAGSKNGASFVSWSLKPAAAGALSTRYFFGPKDFDVLASIDRNMVRAIDFGMFSWIVVPLLRALKWINGYLGNYGWSIIALTVIINLVMFPLRHKSVVSMRKMQEIQPEVKAIQERYAKLKVTDPAKQKMNVEMMNLYRERGVNPASGCVPMLLTLPVLYAFYAMLGVAIEMRGAPFIWWIHDLSLHDPLFITPVLMGITMFVQQKMTPTTADPMQAKMMLLMPVVFMFMMLWQPSGLVLYWTVSNIWTIGQQAITNRIIGTPALAGRPPSGPRLKNAGGGRTTQAAKERK